MFGTFSFGVSIILVSMCTNRFAYGTASMYRYTKNRQNRPYTTISCLRTHVPSLLQCASNAFKSSSVTFLFHTEPEPDGYLCRWNCYFIYSYESLELCKWPCTAFEVEWKSKAVQQESPVASSVYGGDYNKYSPIHASDGLLSILIMPDKIFSSSTEDSPWIRVDLWEISTIQFLRVFMRTDYGGEKFHDTAVEVSNSTAYVQRGFYKGPAMTKEVIEILCEYPTVGRFVQLRILEGTKNNLNILELEIFAVSYLSYMYCDPRGCLVQ